MHKRQIKRRTVVS